MNKVSLFIRKITIPPVFATLLLSLVYAFNPTYFGSIWQMFVGLFFLAVLPVLAYPLQRFIPKFKDKGRDGQRTLAMIFSFIGYLAGTCVALVCNVPKKLFIIYLTYLLCGISILISNKLFKFKASGHACGIVGPVFLLAYFKHYISAILSAFIIIPVFISSIKTKRHTSTQLIGGSIIPLVTTLFVTFIIK